MIPLTTKKANQLKKQPGVRKTEKKTGEQKTKNRKVASQMETGDWRSDRKL